MCCNVSRWPLQLAKRAVDWPLAPRGAAKFNLDLLKSASRIFFRCHTAFEQLLCTHHKYEQSHWISDPHYAQWHHHKMHLSPMPDRASSTGWPKNILIALCKCWWHMQHLKGQQWTQILTCNDHHIAHNHCRLLLICLFYVPRFVRFSTIWFMCQTGVLGVYIGESDQFHLPGNCSNLL